ncbi:type 1 glutamine amidotransferase family protein, partial [Rhizobium sp. 23-156Da]
RRDTTGALIITWPPSSSSRRGYGSPQLMSPWPNKPIAAVCHGVAALLHVQTNVGAPLVQGRKVTGFSNDEERAAHGIGVVPFLIEDQVRQIGGDFSSGPEWAPHVVVDHKLITGQNPASSLPAAIKLLELINRG